MPDWRSPDSITAKRQMLEAAYGADVPTYMYFDLGSMEAGCVWAVQPDIVEKASRMFFNRALDFGAIEVHSSLGFTGSNMSHVPVQNLPPFGVLRIRNADRVHYMLELGGRECHMVEFYSDRGYDKRGEGGGEKQYGNHFGRDGVSPNWVNFIGVWGDPSGPNPEEAPSTIPRQVVIEISSGQRDPSIEQRSIVQRVRDVLGL